MKRYQSEFSRGATGTLETAANWRCIAANALPLPLASALFNPMPSRASMRNRSSEVDSPQEPTSSAQARKKVAKTKTDPQAPSPERLARLTVGELGEDLVADWVQSQGGRVLAKRWRCRRGELDVVALMQDPGGQATPGQAHRTSQILCFIEVKTRSRGNWDADGLLAITPTKQRRLWHSAQTYLAQQAHYSTFPCRFDIALIRCKARPRLKAEVPQKMEPLLKNSERTEKLTIGKAAPKKAVQPSKSRSNHQAPVMGQPVHRNNYCLTLEDYIPDAFRLD